MAAPDAWQEQFLFSVQIQGGTAIEFGGITEDITGMDVGDKDIESVAIGNGGRVVKWTPQADETVTVKVWPTDAKLDGAGFAQYFNPQATADSTDPIDVLNTRLRNKHQIIFLWVEDINTAAYNAAGTATIAGDAAYRFVAKNVYITGYKPSFDDKNLSAEITFKWAPFAKAGTSNKTENSTAGTNALVAVASFT